MFSVIVVFFLINRVTKWLINHIRIQFYLSLGNDSQDTTLGPVITIWRDFKFPYSKNMIWKFSSSYLSLHWGVFIYAKYVANTFDTLSWVFAVIPPCTISGYIPCCRCLRLHAYKFPEKTCVAAGCIITRKSWTSDVYSVIVIRSNCKLDWTIKVIA